MVLMANGAQGEEEERREGKEQGGVCGFIAKFGRLFYVAYKFGFFSSFTRS